MSRRPTILKAIKPTPEKTVADAFSLLDSHAADIGHVALAWNHLHETLGELFVAILRSDRGMVAFAAWQAVASDRSKRAMLISAAQQRVDKHAKIAAEIKWACDQMNSLEDSNCSPC